MLNRDRLMNLPVKAGATAAMQVIDALQKGHSPEAQVLGAAAVFVLLSERFGVSMQDVMGAIKKLMNHAEGRRPEFAAVAEYLAKEV
jgi:hypothetical protein